MKKPHIILQTWPFNCLTCEHAWESVYEACHADDGRGGQVITWRYKGTASMPPWIDPSCPSCSSFRVKTLPPGFRRPAEEEEDTTPPIVPHQRRP
jgi:hypothetical protein